MAGQYAGQAKQQAYENKIMAYEHERQQQHAFNQLEQEFGEEFSPQNRNTTLREVGKWLQANGLSDDLLRDVEDPNVIAVSRRAMKAIQKEQSDRITIAGLKAKVRELNSALGRGEKKAARGRQLGQRKNGPVGENQLDQITELLFGGDK